VGDFSLLSSTEHRHSFASDTPIVRIHLIDGDDGGGRVFPQGFLQQAGYALDEDGFLFGGGAFTRDADVDVGHGGLLCSRVNEERRFTMKDMKLLKKTFMVKGILPYFSFSAFKVML
jgi:hypothetical protein